MLVAGPASHMHTLTCCPCSITTSACSEASSCCDEADALWVCVTQKSLFVWRCRSTPCVLGPALRGRAEVAGSRFHAAWLAVRPRTRRGIPADTLPTRSPGQEDWHALSSVPIELELIATPWHRSRAAELLRRSRRPVSVSLWTSAVFSPIVPLSCAQIISQHDLSMFIACCDAPGGACVRWLAHRCSGNFAICWGSRG